MVGVKMIKCPSCARVQEPRLICSECGAPLASGLDSFAALGLPRKLVINPASLERTYHDLAARIHPDRFANGSAAVRDASLRAMALLTNSYRTLRDPVSRGLYWLELNGQKLAENNKQVPPELAEFVFEVQEEIEELREAHARDGESAAGVRSGVDARRAEIQTSLDESFRQLERNYERWDAGSGTNNDALVSELKSILSRIAYMRTLLRDVDRELGPFRRHELR